MVRSACGAVQVNSRVELTMRLVSVAVPVPMLEPLTYALPEDVAVPPVGARVLVPLGTRMMTGCVLGTANGAGGEDSARSTQIKEVVDVLDDRPFLPDDVVALAVWVADYYAMRRGRSGRRRDASSRLDRERTPRAHY